MEDVAAAEFDTRLRPKTTDPTDCAVLVLVHTLVEQCLIVCITSCHCNVVCLLRAVRIEARKAFYFAEEAAAGVSTSMNFITVLTNHILALLAKTDVIEGTLGTFDLFITLIYEFFATEAALFGGKMSLVLFAILAGVVGSDAAAVAEVLLTRPTPHPILAHVNAGAR